MDRTLVIIPTYNEVENIEKIIKKIFSEKSFDILVVDDSSPDGTADKVIELSYQFKNKLFLKGGYKKRGIGKAYLIGFKWALQKKYDYIFQMDADLSHNPKELSKMLDYLKNDVGLIVGSRYVDGINVVNWPLSRILLSYFASLYVRILTLMPIKDPTSGFVGYRRNVLDSLGNDKIRFSGYAFQIEMKFKTWKKNFIIKEHPIVFVNRTDGVSKMNGSIIWEAFFGVFFLIFESFFFKKNVDGKDFN
ncbi:MAG: polyprenol monophosphomannose synthase [Bacteroidota bacterium]|nr:polyprenol monophosphomannose synthase [Bacteroidota bacterium]